VLKNKNQECQADGGSAALDPPYYDLGFMRTSIRSDMKSVRNYYELSSVESGKNDMMLLDQIVQGRTADFKQLGRLADIASA
jgi:hypothetical protein